MVSTGQPSVRIADQVLSRGLAESDASLWQRSLQGAYVAGLVPECLCSPAPVPMYIARLGDTYMLKRRPKTGHLHHADCESHGGISDAAFRLYTAEAISERPDGKVVHTLSVPLTTVEHVNPEHTLDEVAAPPAVPAAQHRLPEASLGALEKRIVENFDRQSGAFYTSGHVLKLAISGSS